MPRSLFCVPCAAGRAEKGSRKNDRKRELSVIELKHVSKKYDSGANGGVDALKDVSLTIEDGDIYGIIGMSGAGKSTLVRCINLLERPTEGEIIVDGQRLDTMTPAQLRAARRNITMIFQHFNLLMQRTCLRNVCFPMELAGVKKADAEKRARELLELVGLPDKAEAYPAQLSGGQQQRVAIARALATDPQVLLCDEAPSALDPKTTRQILELIRDINRKLNLTIVLITHQMEVVKEICDRVAVIENGNILEEGSMYRVFTNPQQDTTKEFVRTVNDIKLPPLFRKDRVKQSYFPGAKLIVNLEFLSDPDAPETKDGTADAYQPVVSTIIKKFGVDVNILSGKVDYLKDAPYGTLLVEVIGGEDAIRQSLAYLESVHVKREVLGYVG